MDADRSRSLAAVQWNSDNELHTGGWQAGLRSWFEASVHGNRRRLPMTVDVATYIDLVADMPRLGATAPLTMDDVTVGRGKYRKSAVHQIRGCDARGPRVTSGTGTGSSPSPGRASRRP